jgi:hypothetical protein
MLLHEGYQIYFGPTQLAVEYFCDLGFEKPARATTADFLTSVTHPAERRIREGYEARVPRSAKDFANAWARSDMAKALLERVKTSIDSDQRVPQRYDIINPSSICQCDSSIDNRLILSGHILIRTRYQHFRKLAYACNGVGKGCEIISFLRLQLPSATPS